MSKIRPTTVRPIGVYVLSGLAVAPASALRALSADDEPGSTEQGDGPGDSPTDRQSDCRLLAVDTIRGYLVDIDPKTNNTTILNSQTVADWIGATGLAVWENTLWFTRGNAVFKCDASTLFTPTLFTELPYTADGVAVWESNLYVTCQKAGYIYIYQGIDQNITQSDHRTWSQKIPQPGVGIENITATAAELWVCDRAEQSVYCLDRTTGKLKFSAITPFSSPTGIAFYPTADGSDPICYVSYANEEAYIRDDPNSEDPYQLTFRDRTFIHPLHIHHNPTEHYTLSNGYLTEISYVEELLPLDDIPALHNVEWRIALPADTPRQKVRHVEAIGHPFTEEIQEGQRVAVFKFDELTPHQAGLVGWKATIEMYSIKYNLTAADVESAPPLSADFQQRYLIDDDELAMDSEIIQRAAKEAVGTETNILRKALRIRNYVYDKLAYGIQPRIDTPDVALARGVGSCGEYVGILLALFRLNGIACRTIGRYKCPPKPELRNLPLEPDYNHVWLEFYVPDIGWLPMESNVDDVIEQGPYPTRFFMGLCWYHTELGKGISFGRFKADNRPDKFSLGNLAINHIRFTIQEELDPSVL
jgi:transglutaminase-like putative cysteine protease